MTRVTGSDCAVVNNLVDTHTHTRASTRTHAHVTLKYLMYVSRGLKLRSNVFLQHNIGNCSAETLNTVLVFPREVFNLSAFSSLYICPYARRFVLMLETRGILCGK